MSDVNKKLLDLLRSFGHKAGCQKNAFCDACTCGVDAAIAAAEQAQQGVPVALIMCDGKSYDFMVTVEGQKRIPDTGEFVHLYAAQPPATAVCKHRIADARNQIVKSGYLCVDCGALFGAADHFESKTPAVAVPDGKEASNGA